MQANFKHSNRRRWNKEDIFIFCLLCAVIIVGLFAAWNSSKNLLDSDASSELILANHLYQSKKFISEDWIYSTELRVLNTQLIYAPLFGLFSDWHLVRFWGIIILQVILSASFWFLSASCRIPKNKRCYGLVLLLLPTSIAYGRTVLYQTYYILLPFLLSNKHPR